MKIKSIKNSIINHLPISNNDRIVLGRRVNKLIKDPKGFLKGSYKKRSTQIISKNPIKYKVNNSFTVVSAVYNVEKYLDDYFKSLINQNMSFKRNIQLILVDDGSTDSSAKIIKKWQRKYPNNIKYIYKENGGQSSARNLGLKYVKSDWVTFIDPDDKIDISFFYNIDKAIIKNSTAKILNTYIKLLSEDGSNISDKHPLKSRFENDIVVFTLDKIDSYINLSAASTIFNYDIISNNNLSFDENLNVSFEDAKFIFEYISYLDNGVLLYLSKSVYFYRKHNQSTTAISWVDRRKYIDTFTYGYLESLKLCEKKPRLEKLIKKTVLYDINNYLNFLINKPQALKFLTYEKNNFFDLLIRTIKKIDDEKLIFYSGMKYINKAFILYYMGKNINNYFFLDGYECNGLHFVFSEEYLVIDFLHRNEEIKDKLSLQTYNIGKVTLTSISLNFLEPLKVVVRN